MTTTTPTTEPQLPDIDAADVDPRFWEAFHAMRRLVDAEGLEKAMHNPEHMNLQMTMLKYAPDEVRRYCYAKADEVIARLPKATHVTETGEPWHSVEQMAAARGISADEAGPHYYDGPIFPLH